MKSHSDPDLEKLACLECTHAYNASICFQADDRRIYYFATAHFLDGLVEANPDLQANTPPQRLILRFTTGEATILGSNLERIEDRLAEGRLRSLKPVDSRYVYLLKAGPIISRLIVHRKTDL